MLHGDCGHACYSCVFNQKKQEAEQVILYGGMGTVRVFVEKIKKKSDLQE